MPQVRAILTFQDAGQLAAILRPRSAPDAMWDRVDFDLAESTAPEAPGA